MIETCDSSLLSFHRIHGLPPSFYYIPNFITAEEESQLLTKIPSNRWITLTHRRLQPHPSKLTASNVLLSAPLPPFLSDPILPRFKEYGVFQNTPHGAPNHVLLNEYRRGEGIMLHEDGAAYAPVVATVSLGGSVVLDLVEKQPHKDICDSTHDERETDDDKLENGNGEKEKRVEEGTRYHILQEPRSLLITTGNGYMDFMHGIAEVQRDENIGLDTIVNWELLGNSQEFENGVNERVTRTSLTYRDVLKVSKAASKILGPAKK
ncbi:MAG: hypothetical protein M1821_007531 [Bathelium mastoideum]|nr:MAG: hypothetical protein M1821_007531 [Bathelium mastoideum]KAI9695034.1 MAG: hypothetical protein M1822_000651 [Bathelium mastoideum]